MTNDNINDQGTLATAENISKEVPEIKQFNLLDNLTKSLKKQKINLKPDNPFLKVKGEYTFDIDTSKSNSEKTEYIHKKITDYLFEKTGKLFVFKPGDNSKVYALDDISSNKPTSFSVSRLLKEKEAPQDIQKLITQYPAIRKSKVKIKISTDPLDIVKKSTNQSWDSCERVGDNFCQGIFSDIENNNAIAYIYLGDKKEPDGRFMLRWCDTPEKKADIGIEPIMYPRKSYSMEVYDLLRRIIKSKGYGSYSSCSTPYTYEGYSDYLGGSGIIKYNSDESKNSNAILISYASLPDISRNLALALAEHTTPREVRNALADNPTVCDIEEVSNKLSKDINENIKIHLIHTCVRNINVEQSNKLTEVAINNLANDENEDVRGTLAKVINNVDNKYYNKFARDTPKVRYEFAQNSEICKSRDMVNLLSQDIDDRIKINLIGTCNKSNNLTKTVIDNLIKDNEKVRGMLASKLGDEKYLNILANDKSDYVKSRLSNNSQICKFDDIVNKLSKDPDNNVKLNLIGTCTTFGNKLTKTAINNLKKDINEDIRSRLEEAIKVIYIEI